MYSDVFDVVLIELQVATPEVRLNGVFQLGLVNQEL